MDEDRIEVTDYLASQNFSEQEIDNLYAGKPEYKDREEQDAAVRI